MLRFLKKSLLVLIPALSFSAFVAAQDSSSIAGTVTDASGAVIPGATIELLNPATGKSYKAVAGANGAYAIADVPPGPNYKETVSRDGFQTTVMTGLYM